MNNLNYGVIGNGKTAFLISDKGNIEWGCLPEFNSSSAFAKILDKNIGGEFGFKVDEAYEVTQKYWDNTNILVTYFTDGDDKFEVWDFMPMYKTESGDFYHPADVVRYVKYISGSPKMKVNYNPRLGYAKHDTHSFANRKYIKSYTQNGAYESIYLYTNLDYEQVLQQETITLSQDAFFLISYNEKIIKPDLHKANLELQRTEVYWLNWVEKGLKFKSYTKEIVRSSLVLRLLTYNKTGAILAAITTSLPETIGEVRNWDYRFCWIRDSAMILRVLLSMGYRNEAYRFLSFILDVVPNKDEKIQIMYGIRGEKQLTEQILEHLEGYEGSSPVRIGNDAYRQKQNDIYGVLIDVIYQNFKNFHISLDVGEDLWTITKGILRSVKEHWKLPDKSIWEIRTEDRHFTFSKVLCWVAADRGEKIATILKKDHHQQKWQKLKEEIKQDILKNAWDEELQVFTQSYGNKDLDASNLLMEYYGFIEATDERFISTVKCTYENLSHNGLMYRYRNRDDFGTPSSSFIICSFWMIQSLYKIGEIEKARNMFDNLLAHSNHVGLFSEDMDFESKRLLGNFPQGYSHLALIETAILFSDGMTDDFKVIQAMS